jgi:hypothetical protein
VELPKESSGGTKLETIKLGRDFGGRFRGAFVTI